MPSVLLGVFIPIHLNVCSAACIWRSSRIIAAFATDVYSYRRNCQTTRKQTMKQFKYLFASVKVEAVNFLRVTGYSNNNLLQFCANWSTTWDKWNKAEWIECCVNVFEWRGPLPSHILFCDSKERGLELGLTTFWLRNSVMALLKM